MPVIKASKQVDIAPIKIENNNNQSQVIQTNTNNHIVGSEQSLRYSNQPNVHRNGMQNYGQPYTNQVMIPMNQGMQQPMQPSAYVNPQNQQPVQQPMYVNPQNQFGNTYLHVDVYNSYNGQTPSPNMPIANITTDNTVESKQDKILQTLSKDIKPAPTEATNQAILQKKRDMEQNIKEFNSFLITNAQLSNKFEKAEVSCGYNSKKIEIKLGTGNFFYIATMANKKSVEIYPSASGFTKMGKAQIESIFMIKTGTGKSQVIKPCTAILTAFGSFEMQEMGEVLFE